MQKYVVAIQGLLAFLYLVYPSAGVFELIPDAIPLIGSLDEATASVLLLASLRYYGLDLTSWWQGASLPDKSKQDSDT